MYTGRKPLPAQLRCFLHRPLSRPGQVKCANLLSEAPCAFGRQDPRDPYSRDRIKGWVGLFVAGRHPGDLVSFGDGGKLASFCVGDGCLNETGLSLGPGPFEVNRFRCVHRTSGLGSAVGRTRVRLLFHESGYRTNLLVMKRSHGKRGGGRGLRRVRFGGPLSECGELVSGLSPRRVAGRPFLFSDEGELQVVKNVEGRPLCGGLRLGGGHWTGTLLKRIRMRSPPYRHVKTANITSGPSLEVKAQKTLVRGLHVASVGRQAPYLAAREWGRSADVIHTGVYVSRSWIQPESLFEE